ncbi:hypothetical protein MKX30_17265 [Paenibacillus sp. FSL P2-0173]
MPALVGYKIQCGFAVKSGLRLAINEKLSANRSEVQILARLAIHTEGGTNLEN